MSGSLTPALVKRLSKAVKAQLPPNKRFMLVIVDDGDTDVRYVSITPRAISAVILEELAAKIRAGTGRAAQPKFPLVGK